MDTKKPLVAIVGQTASGKSSLAIKLAQKFSGEIICADSRTVYRYMNIGTAKPSDKDRKLVPHHGLDLVNPDQSFSAANFKQYSLEKISQINSRNNLPVVVGGTGLYIDGLLYDFKFSAKPEPKIRLKLEGMRLGQLQKKALKLEIDPQDIDFKNKRHLSRAIERGGVFKNKSKLSPNILIFGLILEDDILEKRIIKRVEQMIANGLVEESNKIINEYWLSAPGLLAPGYKAMIRYVNGELNIDQAKNEFIKADKNLAKRQKTWFKRNKDIVWINNYSEAENILAAFLQKFDTISK